MKIGCPLAEENFESSEVKSDEGSSSNASAVKTAQMKVVKPPVFNIPTWLRKYYDYDGHQGGKKNLVMTCKLCKMDNEKQGGEKKIQFHGRGLYNFVRHVQVANFSSKLLLNLFC